MAGDMEISLGFDGAAADAGARSFWDRQQAHIRAFNRYAKPALLGVAGSFGFGTKAVMDAAQDSVAVKRQVEDLGSAWHAMLSRVGRDIADAGIVTFLADSARWLEKTRQSLAAFVTKEAGGDPDELKRIQDVQVEQDKRQREIEERRKVFRDLEQRTAAAQPDSLAARLRIIELQNLALREQINTNERLSSGDRAAANAQADKLSAIEMQNARLKYQEELAAAVAEVDRASQERSDFNAQLQDEQLQRDIDRLRAAGGFDRDLRDQREAWEIEKLRKQGLDAKADALKREIDLREKLHEIEVSDLDFADKAILSKQFRDLYAEMGKGVTPGLRPGTLSTNFGSPYSQLVGSVLNPPGQQNGPAQQQLAETREIRKGTTAAVKLLEKMVQRGTDATYAA